MLKKNDIEINEKFKLYNTNPCLVVIKVQEESVGLPTQAYCSQDEISEDGHMVKNFIHIKSSIDASEAEAVGVEHLLREIKDVSIGDLSKEVANKGHALRALITKIEEMKQYLQDVHSEKYPVNPEIINNI